MSKDIYDELVSLEWTEDEKEALERIGKGIKDKLADNSSDGWDCKTDGDPFGWLSGES